MRNLRMRKLSLEFILRRNNIFSSISLFSPKHSQDTEDESETILPAGKNGNLNKYTSPFVFLNVNKEML